MNSEVEYIPAGPTVQAFHEDPSFVRCLLGPYGSGKSSACLMELVRRAGLQAKGPDGIRRSRFAIIRATYPQLKTTTLRTFEQWVPQSVGKLNSNPPMVFRMRKGSTDAEFVFLALESDADVDKLTSLELTGAWINEAREIPESILTNLKGRVGRFPSAAQGGCTWAGVILDSNPPADTSWLYRVFEVDRPEGHRIFKQPSGMSPDAENLTHLHGGQEYYRRMLIGADPDWARAHVHGEYSHIVEGKPVFHNFRDNMHVASEPLAAIPGLPLLIGVDFGLTPSALIGQRLADGRWLILSELHMDDAGVERFAKALTGLVATKYPSHEVAGVWGDPAGNHRMETDERTALNVLAEKTGWRVRPAAPTNSWTLRLEVSLAAFARLVDGKPGVLISPECPLFRQACAGGYHYRLLRTGNGLDYADEPAKSPADPASHLADSFQYLLLGAGEANIVMNKVARAKRKPLPGGGSGSDYDVLDAAYGRDGGGGSERRRQDYLTRIGFYEADFR